MPTLYEELGRMGEALDELRETLKKSRRHLFAGAIFATLVCWALAAILWLL